MSLKFSCDDKATLVAYLYNEVDAADRQRVEDHLRECLACEIEVGALSGVRSGLTQWAPPDAELGFAIIQKSVRKPAQNREPVQEPALTSASWWKTVPVWAQAVAAVLVLAVSAAIANVQIKSGPDGLVVSTGWMTPASATTAVAPVTAPAAGDQQWRTALIALEQQFREEIRTTRETGVVRAASRSGVDDATLTRVQALLAASETKQQRELALRMTQLAGDINVQRRADLLRVEQAIGHTGVEMARQGERLNYVIRAAGVPRQ